MSIQQCQIYKKKKKISKDNQVFHKSLLKIEKCLFLNDKFVYKKTTSAKTTVCFIKPENIF